MRHTPEGQASCLAKLRRFMPAGPVEKGPEKNIWVRLRRWLPEIFLTRGDRRVSHLPMQRLRSRCILFVIVLMILVILAVCFTKECA